MKTNKFLDRYMNLQAAQGKAWEEIRKLGYKNKTWPVSIRPNHFNHFYLDLNVNGESIGLPISDAREMAQYILDVTDGLEDTHDITNEIIKRKA